MNIINEEREDIILENNTAQHDFEDYIENLNKRSITIDIREPLHGDLDLSVIRDFGFHNVRKLVFR